MRETPQPPTTSLAGPPHDHTLGATALTPAVYRMRQNATEHDRMQRNATETRARA